MENLSQLVSQLVSFVPTHQVPDNTMLQTDVLVKSEISPYVLTKYQHASHRADRTHISSVASLVIEVRDAADKLAALQLCLFGEFLFPSHRARTV
jgi:hypothetical protein